MGLVEAYHELCMTEGPAGEIAERIGEGLYECGNSIVDAIDVFTETLDEVEEELAELGSGESCGDADREDPEWETTPGAKAMMDAADSIVNFCNKAGIAIDEVAAKVMEMLDRAMGAEEEGKE